MAEFEIAYEKTIKAEGGYKLHEVKDDRGGMTYAGIARKFHPNWEGWGLLDRGLSGSSDLTGMVRTFYLANFWSRIKGDQIEEQKVADSLYDFAVNAGVRNATKLAQIAVGATPDGVIGPKTLERLNEVDEDVFCLQYFVAKITRYAAICSRNPKQKKFLLGWTNRTIAGLQNG